MDLNEIHDMIQTFEVEESYEPNDITKLLTILERVTTALVATNTRMAQLESKLEALDQRVMNIRAVQISNENNP
jgi:polyhydroxyalkanoate synthesis regulator phasin